MLGLFYNTAWPGHPMIYEIYTWVWLSALSQLYNRPITLANVPTEQWDALASLGVDAIWFMGVWERSPQSVALALADEQLQADFRRALPGYTPADTIGSAYAVRRYSVDPHLGGPDGLASARQQLALRGLRLLLDFVPNHLALDHPWTFAHPDYFVQGTHDDLAHFPEEFFEVQDHVFANGRDPYFAPWRDVVQVNAFNPALRQAIIEELYVIANQCDGLRCDMAMLLMNDIFKRTWGDRVAEPPPQEYWVEIISAVHSRYPSLLFVAEAYWDTEWSLQQLGFDYCYDKRLYDRLEHENALSLYEHLTASLTYQDKLIRFIENHDEPRAAATFSPEKESAAALLILTLPGAKLLYEGQFEGRTVRLPVFLARRPVELVNSQLQAFYLKLLAVLAQEKKALRQGDWQLGSCSGWPDNQSDSNLLSWTWTWEEERILLVINFSDAQAEGRVHLPWTDLAGRQWQLTDLLSGESFARDGHEMASSGLYVDLPAWHFYFFRCH